MNSSGRAGRTFQLLSLTTRKTSATNAVKQSAHVSDMKGLEYIAMGALASAHASLTLSPTQKCWWTAGAHGPEGVSEMVPS